jgi:hypothetical protein
VKRRKYRWIISEAQRRAYVHNWTTIRMRRAVKRLLDMDRRDGESMGEVVWRWALERASTTVDAEVDGNMVQVSPGVH